jgi:hypothetical protein
MPRRYDDDMERVFYTGAGSHIISEILPSKLRNATIIAGNLEELGLVLRTGDAEGFDNAFRKGVKQKENKVIYDKNTWKSVDVGLWEKAVEIALRDHPARSKAMSYINLLGRNAFQVLGDDLESPSRFLICWTKNGKDVGGTGTTMRIAMHYNVPIFNLRILSAKEILERITKIL